jgi:hypothetical protein
MPIWGQFAQSTGPNPSIFNGGKSQSQSTFLQTANDFPFINLLKTAQQWSNNGNLQPPPDSLDSNGYPTSLPNGGVFTVFSGPTQAERPGNYVVTWQGNGTVSLGFSWTAVSGSLTSTTGSGRFVITPNTGSFNVGISAIGSPYITNLQFYHINDEPALLAGEIFGTLFKSRLKAARFGVYRFLDWSLSNISNVSQWAHRKPTSYVFYQGHESRGSLYAGASTNVGNAYSITFGTGAPVDKQLIIFKVSASATSATISLNLNGTGAVPIGGATGQTPIPFTTTPLLGGVLANVVYDATLNVWLLYGGGLYGDFTAGIINGVPPEVCVQLCIELGMHPWFPSYYLTVDPISDYVISLAQYIKNNAPAWMIPRFEGPNEQWNGSFSVFGYSSLKGSVYWDGSATINDWMGKVMSVIGQAVSAVYGNDRTRYKVICGVQTSTTPSASNTRLSSAQYVAQAAAPQTGYTKTPAYQWVTGVCIAPYWPLPGIAGDSRYIGYCYQYSVSPSPAILNSFVTSNPDPGPPYGTITAGWKTWATGFNAALQVDAYEGGYNETYLTSDVHQTITSATNANPAVLSVTNNGGAVGQTVTITGATGGTWSTINGNSYTVQAVTPASSITINLDSTSLGTLSSATITYTGSQAYANVVFLASFDAPAEGTYLTSVYNNYVANGGEFPSQYDFCSPNQGGARFSIWYPGIYGGTDSASDPGNPMWQSIISFNN